MKLNNGTDGDSDNDVVPSQIWAVILLEARAVSLWCCVSIVFRLVVQFVCTVSSYKDDNGILHEVGFLEEPISEDFFSKSLWTIASVACGWLLCLVPSKICLQQAPGFMFSNPALLLWVRDRTGVIPNLPTRACEYVLGRISLKELVIIQPVHLVTMVSTLQFLRKVLPEHLLSLALEPIEYSNDENTWTVDFGREVAVTAAFTVALLVLPVLFELNDFPRWSVIVLFYPLFQFAVDGTGMAASFAPNVSLGLCLLGYRPLPAGYRFVGSLLGGLIGGKIMKRYFPDDTK